MKILILFFGLFFVANDKIDEFFGKDYAAATKLMKNDEKTITAECGKLHVNAVEVQSVVFPEYIRFSILSELAEEKALELLYVSYGENEADFSIGHFQMKPSFADKLEQIVNENKFGLKNKYNFLLIKSKNKEDERAVRVARLKELKWQVRYACCFIEYGKNTMLMNDVATANTIKYLATLYNFGLLNTKKEIENKFDCACFPYGKKFDVKQVNYWEVAVNYLNKQK